MKKTLNISGMHCASCEVLLERQLKTFSEIKKIEISAKTGKAEIEYEGEFPEKEIENLLESFDYGLIGLHKEEKVEKTEKFTLKDFFQLIFISGIFLLIIYLFQKSNFIEYLPNISGEVNIFIALSLGIIASLSTCLVLTGSIVIGFSSLYKKNEKSLIYRFLPQFYFHLGRIGGFFILGGLLGLIGSKINYSPSITLVFSGFIAILMFYIALKILNIIPSFKSIAIHLPKKYSHKIYDLQKKENGFIPVIVGLLTFFLPCGFTQTVQLAAVASGNFWTAATMMAFFALGTFPILLIVGLSSSYINSNKLKFLQKIIAVVIIFFSLYSLNTVLTLSGSRFSIDFWSKNNQAMEEIVIIEDDYQIAKININYAINTKELKVKKGIPVHLEIDAVNLTGCVDELIIPKLDFTTGKLSKGLNEFEIIFDEVGIYPFSCWMGMQGGKFIVE